MQADRRLNSDRYLHMSETEPRTEEVQQEHPIPMPEFISLMALMMSLVALSIDSMLPALPAIGVDLGATGENETQLVLSALFAGLSIGQLFYGPVSDSIGRRPAIYIGVAVFIVGSLCSIFAQSFEMMLIGRALQGLGAAGNRIIIIALIRDGYAGRAMARIMSFVLSLFILVPIIAPALGQVILWVADWRTIFVALLVISLASAIWFGMRQPETLPPSRRRPFSAAAIAKAFGEAGSNRVTLGYTVAIGLIFGCFQGYLVSSQQIFQEIYLVGDLFALYFAIPAVAFGVAGFVNARMVMRFGMRRLIRVALVGVVLTAVLFGAFSYADDGVPGLIWLLIYLTLVFFCMGLLFGNLNAVAMEPMGHIAGSASAFIGFFSTLVAILCGLVIGQSFDGTVLPMIVGFGTLCLAALGIGLWADKGLPPRPVTP